MILTMLTSTCTGLRNSTLRALAHQLRRIAREDLHFGKIQPWEGKPPGGAERLMIVNARDHKGSDLYFEVWCKARCDGVGIRAALRRSRQPGRRRPPTPQLRVQSRAKTRSQSLRGFSRSPSAARSIARRSTPKARLAVPAGVRPGSSRRAKKNSGSWPERLGDPVTTNHSFRRVLSSILAELRRPSTYGELSRPATTLSSVGSIFAAIKASRFLPKRYLGPAGLRSLQDRPRQHHGRRGGERRVDRREDRGRGTITMLPFMGERRSCLGLRRYRCRPACPPRGE
jgi:hypothetical protein